MQHLTTGLILALAMSVNIHPKAVVALSESKLPSGAIASEFLLSQVEDEETNSGNFVAVEHPTQGQVSIVEEDGKRYIEFSEDFATDPGPALRVILHTGEMVELQIEEGDYTSLGVLQAVNGSQRYAIPEDVDLEQYNSVAIWCEQFNATFGYAPLPEAEE